MTALNVFLAEMDFGSALAENITGRNTGTGRIGVERSASPVVPVYDFANVSGGDTTFDFTPTDSFTYEIDVADGNLAWADVAAPVADFDLGGFKITNVGDATGNDDLVNLQTLDNEIALASLETDAKDPVRIRLTSVADFGAVARAQQSISPDLEDGDRVLVDAGASEDGIYTVSAHGSNSALCVLTRSTDTDDIGELSIGLMTHVLEGTDANTKYIAEQAPDINGWYLAARTISSLTGSSSVTVSGGVASINTSWAGQATIDTLGTISTGTWHSDVIGVAYGGTGNTTVFGARAQFNLPLAARNATPAWSSNVATLTTSSSEAVLIIAELVTADDTANGYTVGDFVLFNGVEGINDTKWEARFANTPSTPGNWKFHLIAFEK